MTDLMLAIASRFTGELEQRQFLSRCFLHEWVGIQNPLRGQRITFYRRLDDSPLAPGAMLTF
jgi:hypothetical protein